MKPWRSGLDGPHGVMISAFPLSSALSELLRQGYEAKNSQPKWEAPSGVPGGARPKPRPGLGRWRCAFRAGGLHRMLGGERRSM